MQWLNANAAGIQALGSVATVLLTAVLAWITLRYVRLTQRLVSAQLGEASARRRELRTHAAVLTTFLYGLQSRDDPRVGGAILSDSSDLREFSFNRFRALASEVGVEAGRHAAIVEEHVTWLANLVRDIRAGRPRVPGSVNEPLGSATRGYDWTKSLLGREYDEHRISGISALPLLMAEVDSLERGLTNTEG